MKPAAKLSTLKKMNRRLILGCIKGDISCSDIARMTGLSYTCVVTLVDELVRDNVLVKSEAEITTGVGRRPIWVKLKPYRNIVCAVSFTSTSSFKIFDLDGSVLYEEKGQFTTPINLEQIERFASKIEGVLKARFQNCILHNVCVAAPGRFDRETGEMVFSPSFEPGINLMDYFKGRFHVPVALKNDLRFSFIAEKAFGEHRDEIRDTLFVQLGGGGIGCSLYLDDKLYEGANGFSGELGLFIVDYLSNMSAFGRADSKRLFLHKSSDANFVRAAQIAIEEGAESMLEGKEITGETIAEGYVAGDALCTEIINGAVVMTSDVIRSLAEVIDFKNVIVSRKTNKYGQKFIDALSDYLNRHSHLYPIDVKSATFEEEGIMLGLMHYARELALDAIS